MLWWRGRECEGLIVIVITRVQYGCRTALPLRGSERISRARGLRLAKQLNVVSIRTGSTCASVRLRTYERHIVIVDIAHGCIAIRIEDASFAAPSTVCDDVAVSRNTITGRLRCEGHVVVIV